MNAGGRCSRGLKALLGILLLGRCDQLRHLHDTPPPHFVASPKPALSVGAACCLRNSACCLRNSSLYFLYITITLLSQHGNSGPPHASRGRRFNRAPPPSESNQGEEKDFRRGVEAKRSLGYATGVLGIRAYGLPKACASSTEEPSERKGLESAPWCLTRAEEEREEGRRTSTYFLLS
jgi:hypothetical protein